MNLQKGFGTIGRGVPIVMSHKKIQLDISQGVSSNLKEEMLFSERF